MLATANHCEPKVNRTQTNLSQKQEQQSDQFYRKWYQQLYSNEINEVPIWWKHFIMCLWFSLWCAICEYFVNTVRFIDFLLTKPSTCFTWLYFLRSFAQYHTRAHTHTFSISNKFPLVMLQTMIALVMQCAEQQLKESLVLTTCTQTLAIALCGVYTNSISDRSDFEPLFHHFIEC